MKPIEKLEPRISIIGLHVRDIKRSYEFYAKGLGFPTDRKPEDGWLGFKLNGIVFCIYPYENLKAENLERKIDADRAIDRSIMPSTGLAYNTREKHQVEEVLALAERCGGTIEKEPKDTFWGGYSGYFSDPDGHLWEVAWAESWEFNSDGSLVL
ncbi:MAG: VOC family protein [Akkermansiaceae bacterium]